MGRPEPQGKLYAAAGQDWAECDLNSNPIWDVMLDSAGVGQGTRLLDIGCGGGNACVLASRRGAAVAGLDTADALIQVARERVPSGDFRVGDMVELPYAAKSFDVVFASMSIMFASDPAVAMREMKRVTEARGRVTVGIWGQPADCEYRHLHNAMVDLLPTPLPSAGPFALAGPGELEGLMASAGLQVFDSGEVDTPFRFDDLENMWRMVGTFGPMQRAKQVVGEETLRTTVMQAAQPFHTDNGEILLRNRFRYVTATA